MISLLVFLVIAGFVVWVAMQVPMPQIVKNIIIGLVCLFLFLYVLKLLGLWNGPALNLR
jgi:hypothetical protein